MAYNVGFAQVTVTPVFTGMQKAITGQVNKTFPAAGRQAGSAMASGVAATAGGSVFTRAFSKVGTAAATMLGAAGAPAAANFTSRLTSGISTGIGRMGGALTRATGGLTAAMSAAGASAGTGFSASMMRTLGPLAALFGVGSVATAGFGRLTGIENAEAKLRALGYTMEQVKTISDATMESVKGTPYAFNDAMGIAVGLLASGIEPGKALTEELSRIADAATIAGIPLNEMGAIWNKAAAQGRIQGEEINQLGDRGIPILQALADHLGITVAEVRQMSREGTISFDLFSAAMDSKLSGSALRAAETTTGAFSNMKAGLARFGAEVLSSLGFDSWRDAIVGVTNALDGLTGWISKNKTLVSSLATGFAAVSLAAAGLSLGVRGVAAAFNFLAQNKIVVVLGLITSAVIYLWQTNEGFRNVVTTVWSAIQSAIAAAWKAISPVFSAIGKWITDTLGPALSRFYNNVIVPVWTGFRTAISAAWKVVSPIFSGIVTFLRNTLGPAFSWLSSSVVQPVWNAIKFAISGAWNTVRLIFDAIVYAVRNTLGPVFNWLNNSAIGPAMRGAASVISSVWNNNIRPVFNALGNFIRNTVAPAFRSGVNTIRSIWDGLKSAAAAPINFVIDTVYNNGIKAVFDRVAGAIGSSARLPRASTIRTRAVGGFTPKGWTLVGEEGPELVNFTAPGRVYTASDTAQMMRQGKWPGKSSDILDSAPDGGPAEWIGDRWRDVQNGARAVRDAAMNALGEAAQWVRGGLARLAEAVLNPVKNAIRSRISGGGMLGAITGGAATKAIDNLIEWVRGEDSKGPADPQGRSLRGARPHVNAAAWDVADAINPNMRMQAWNQSMHSTHREGRAIDFLDGPNLQRIANYLVANAARLWVTEVIYNHRIWKPGRGWFPLRGGYGNDPGHVWHVHSTHLPSPTHDDGGWLTPGVSTVANYTGKAEAVLTARQWNDYHRLAESVARNGTSTTVYVQIDPKDLAGLKSVEEFTTMLRRKTRQAGGTH